MGVMMEIAIPPTNRNTVNKRRIMVPLSITIEIADPESQRFQPMDVLVDDRIMATVIPASELLRIGIVPTERKVFEHPDGKQVELGMAQAIVRLHGQETHTWVVFGEEFHQPTLGIYTLNGLFIRVDEEIPRLIPANGPLPL